MKKPKRIWEKYLKNIRRSEHLKKTGRVKSRKQENSWYMYFMAVVYSRPQNRATFR